MRRDFVLWALAILMAVHQPVWLAAQTPSARGGDSNQTITIQAGTRFKASLQTPVSTKLSDEVCPGRGDSGFHRRFSPRRGGA